MSEWRTIDSAPKGEEVLLYEPELTNRQGRVSHPARMVVERWPTYYPRQATHWMPLPPPPGSDEEQEPYGLMPVYAMKEVK